MVDRSLVNYDEDSGRYFLLETVRQYSADHQVNSGESASLRDAHLDYFLELATNARNNVRGAEQVYWLALYDAEYDNIRLAMDWALSNEDSVSKGILLAYRLADYWMIRSSFQESQAWIDRMMSVRELTEIEQGRLQVIRSSIGYFRAMPRPDEAMATIALAKRTGDAELIGDALATAILDLLVSGRVDEARSIQVETFAALSAIDDHVMTAFVHINFGNNAFLRGDLEVAEHHYEQCYLTRSRAKDIRGVGAALNSLGYVKERRGLNDEAINLFRRGISAYFLVSSVWDLGGGLCCMGLELSTTGRMDDLARILGFGDALLKKVGGRRDQVDSIQYAHWMARTSEVLGASEFEAKRKEGARMTLASVKALLFPDGIEVPVLEEEG